MGCVVCLKDTGHCSAWTTFHRCCCCSTGFAALGRRSRRKTEETLQPHVFGAISVSRTMCVCVCACLLVSILLVVFTYFLR